MKENGDFMRAEEENSTETSEKNRNKSWRTNTRKIKETDSPDDMGVTSRTEPIVNYQEGENITVKDHKINNVTPQTDNTILIYDGTTKEVYIGKQERIKPKSSSNDNIDKPDFNSEKRQRARKK